MNTIFKACFVCILLLNGFRHASAQSTASSSNAVSSTTPNLSANKSSVQEQPQIQQRQLPATTSVQNNNASIEPYKSTRGIPMPVEVERLVGAGKIAEALAEFENLKKSQTKADKFDLQFLEMTIYREAVYTDPNNAAEYKAKEETLVKQLIEQFPNVSDAVLLQLTPESSNEDIIRITTKAIELDQTNLFAYEQRGRVLYMIGKTKEACADFEKLPYKNTLPEYQWCKGLNQ